MVPVAGLFRPTAIDVHWASKYLYFSDPQTLKIQRVKLLEEKTLKEDFISVGLNKVEGLAVDWVGNNLYFADEGLQAIFVASLKQPDLRRTLVRDRTNHVRSLAVDPASGRLFWSNWNNIEGTTTAGLQQQSAGSILWSWMDGSEAEVLLDYDLQWPNGLTFDPATSMLYWCDTFLNKIERLNLTGLLEGGQNRNSSSGKASKAGLMMQRRRSVVAADENFTARPYGLTLHKRQLFYSEFVKGRIVGLDLDTNATTVLLEGMPQLFEVKVMTAGLQQPRMRNDCDSLACDELCLLMPGGARCACRQDFVPSGPNGTACTRNTTVDTATEVKVKGKSAHAQEEKSSAGDVTNSVLRSSSSSNVSCGEGEVACASGTTCISRLWLCDGDMVSYTYTI